MNIDERDFVVLGGGPGGYTAAFRAADLGRKVTIIEKKSTLGGVCLNEGCIPSKALLHLSEVLEETDKIREAGIIFQKPSVDTDKIRQHISTVIKKLTDGLDSLAAGRKIELIRGEGKFISNSEIEIDIETEKKVISFKDAVISTGSRPMELPGFSFQEPYVMDSSEALKIEKVPKQLLIIGGGIIGLEMAEIYSGLGSEITIVEIANDLIPSADRDLKQLLVKKIKQKYSLFTSTKVTKIVNENGTVTVYLEGKNAPERLETDAVLISAGRHPNSDNIGLETTDLIPDEKGFISVNQKLETKVKHIFSVGDITGNPMLAHKAAAQGKTAAESASGKPSDFSPLAIPSVAYTNPELAWAGLTENQAKIEGISFRKASFPWQANGRALAGMNGNGITKILFHPETGRILGAGIVGKNAGELISELVLAIEMGADWDDIGETIHPHPTLSETIKLAAEISAGTITELPPQK